MDRIIAVLLIVLVIPIGTPILDTGPDADRVDFEKAEESCIQHERQDAFRVPDNGNPVVSINQTSNQSIIRYSFRGTGGESMFGITLPDGVELVNSSGFKDDEGGLERKYNAENPWIELSTGSPLGNLSYSTSEQNVVVPLPHSEDVDLFFQPKPTGFVGAHFALLGDYTVGTAQNGCQSILVIVPESADLSKSPDKYAQVIATAGNELTIGPQYRLVTAFVAPSDTGERNGFTPRRLDGERPAAEFYISPESQFTVARNTWIHEYIHTRQMTYNPRWMSEGSATFFAAQVSVDQGWISPRQYDSFFARYASPDGVPETSEIADPEYFHGAFFFMQVEEDLRGTNTSAEEVYRKLNVRSFEDRRSERIGAGQVEAIVESETNSSVNYTDPMENSPHVVYLEGPSWLPHVFREEAPFLPEMVAMISYFAVLGYVLKAFQSP